MSYSIKENLEDLIIDKNITLSELSRAINIPYKTLSNYFKGIYMPNLKNAIILANFFNCSLDFLVGLTETNNIQKFKDPDNSFYQRYLDLLKDQNISHYKVVKSLDLNINISRKWRTGSTPTLSVLIKLAKYFDISIDYLIGRI